LSLGPASRAKSSLRFQRGLYEPRLPRFVPTYLEFRGTPHRPDGNHTPRRRPAARGPAPNLMVVFCRWSRWKAVVRGQIFAWGASRGYAIGALLVLPFETGRCGRARADSSSAAAGGKTTYGDIPEGGVRAQKSRRFVGTIAGVGTMAGMDDGLSTLSGSTPPKETVTLPGATWRRPRGHRRAKRIRAGRADPSRIHWDELQRPAHGAARPKDGCDHTTEHHVPGKLRRASHSMYRGNGPSARSQGERPAHATEAQAASRLRHSRCHYPLARFPTDDKLSFIRPSQECPPDPRGES
jgi:hypothetical protein